MRSVILRHDYIADRVAKLIIDLTFRFIAAVEVRPGTATVDAEQRARMALSWSAVDRALLDAVRRTFNGRSRGTTASSPSTQCNSEARSLPHQGRDASNYSTLEEDRVTEAEDQMTSSDMQNHDSVARPQGPSQTSLLMDVQLYVTQLTMIRTKLIGLNLTSAFPWDDSFGGDGQYFEKTWSWLNELVEKERELLAQEGRSGREVKSTFGYEVEAGSEGSVMSSAASYQGESDEGS